MVEFGDRVPCTITEIGPWGAYGLTSGGESVLIAFSELSWDRVRSTELVVQVGDVTDVVIIGRSRDRNQRLLGSIKQAISDNPWKHARLRVGEIYEAVVMRLCSDMLFVELPDGKVIGAPTSTPGQFSEGQTINVRLALLDVESRKGIADIVRQA